jgi:hypothetical protein
MHFHVTEFATPSWRRDLIQYKSKFATPRRGQFG